MSQKDNRWQLTFRILLEQDSDLWVAHCLELDLVAASPSRQEVTDDIKSLILEQVKFCIKNNNMDYLFRNAPKEVWDRYEMNNKKRRSRPASFKPHFSFIDNKSSATGLCCA